MQHEKPIILTDVDGVLVQWTSGLPYFAQKNGIRTDEILKTLVDERFRTGEELFGVNGRIANILMREYNNSDFIKYLAGYVDAIDVVNRLKDQYDFIAITALGDSNQALLNRCCNLNTLFPGAFKDILCVDIGETKMPHYISVKQKYKNRLVCFVDDLVSNLQDCHDAMSQLPQIHMLRTDGAREVKHDINKYHTAKNWYDIEKLLVQLDPKPNTIDLSHHSTWQDKPTVSEVK